MSDNRWQRIENIFHQAAELAPEARPAFLSKVCAGDESLRQEVESLLAHDAEDGSTLANAVAGAAADETATMVEDLTGRVIGPYKLLGRIGAGGMGVVYQARDTQLDRTVAIKLLPADRLADADRRRRFIQEAKAASALNHPNIVTIHAITHEGGAECIVMEYVVGKTLADAIPKKGLPLRQALRIAIEIADAMAAAHAAGIVHRDLKPSNVMLTEAGRVKVLDFGLAKLVEGGEPAETSPGTMTGQVVGTAAYMSPEQAQGRKVDARTDIFAFGCVLYEMVTGRRAFQAESTLSTLAAILHEEPAPIEGVAPEVTKLIGRCLRKDPARRYQHMDELKLALEELKEESASGTAPIPSPPGFPGWAVGALALLLMLAAGVIWWLARSPKSGPAPVLTRVTSDSGLTTAPALSPDGKLLAYASDRSGEGNLDIYVRQVGGGEPIRLTRDPADEHAPAFSPNGTQIAFRSEREGGGIYVVSALGGPARKIASQGRAPRFSPDGNRIAYWIGDIGGSEGNSGGSKIFVVPSSGGEPRQVGTDFSVATDPAWTPDGQHLLFWSYRREARAGDFEWWVAAIEGGQAVATGLAGVARSQKVSVAPHPGIAWSPSGDSIVFPARSGDSTNLWRARVSPRTWKVEGVLERLTFGTTLEQAPSLAAAPSGGVQVAFASLVTSLNVWSVPLDANRGAVLGEPQRLTQHAGSDRVPKVSADGTKVAYSSDRSGHFSTWVKDLNTGVETHLSADPLSENEPTFSPQGDRVAVLRAVDPTWQLPGDKYSIYSIPFDGSPEKKICDHCGRLADWSSDGKRLLFVRLRDVIDGPGHITVCMLDIDSGRQTLLIDHPVYELWQPHFSPDDRWVAFLAAGMSATRIYVVPYRDGPTPENEWITVADGTGRPDQPRWSPDGNLLYITSEQDGFRCIWAQRLDRATKRPTGPRIPVFHRHTAGRSLSEVRMGDLGLGVARDKLVFNMAERTGNIWMTEVGR